MKRSKITDALRGTIYAVVSSVLTLSVLVFALFALRDIIVNEASSVTFFGASLIMLSISRISLALRAKMVYKSQLAFVRNLIFFGAYLVCGIITLSLPVTDLLIYCMCAVYFFTISINRVCLAVEKKKISYMIFNGIIAIFFFLFGLTSLLVMEENMLLLVYTVCVASIMIVSLAETLVFVFSRIQLRGIVKIMKKTYAFEVLYGMVILIVAASFYFTIMEDNIKSFGDGLWYSFAVITTIGFGDLTVTAPVSRVLSVILGLYGIMVTAVITSIIVNFYTEISGKRAEAEKEASLKEMEKKMEEKVNEDVVADIENSKSEKPAEEEPKKEEAKPEPEYPAEDPDFME